MPGMTSWPSKRFRPPTVALVFLAVAVLESLFTIIFSAFLIVHDDGWGPGSQYAVLSILITVFLLYFAANAVFAENRFQLFAFFMVTVCMATVFVVFKAVKYRSFGSLWHKSRLYVLAVKLVFDLAYCVLVPMSARRFGYRIFKTVGADVRLQDMYTVFLQFISLLKLDFAFSIFLLLMSYLFFKISTTELVLEILGLAISLFWLFIGWASAVRESTAGFKLFFAFSPATPAFVIYKLLQLFILSGVELKSGATPAQFAIVGGLFIVVRMLLIYLAAAVLTNFGAGLKDRVFAVSLAHRREQRERAMERKDYGAV